MKLYNFLDLFEIEKTNVKKFDIEITGVNSNSDKITLGNIFVALKGTRKDGNNYIREAHKNGAVVVITDSYCEKLLLEDIPYILVKNARRALALCCGRILGNPEKHMNFIGVTGTNGKSGTVKLLCGIYGESGRKYRDFCTIYGGMTTPDSELFFEEIKKSFDSGVSDILMEVSSHSLFFDKLYGVKFNISAFTNLTRDHLDFHKTMDEYAKAKSKLFCQSKIGLLNFDDWYSEIMAKNSTSKNFFYSVESKNSDFYAENIKYYGESGIEYDLCSPFEKIKITSKLQGKINVYNTLAAASTALLDGVSPECVARGILNVNVITGRMEKLPLEKYGLDIYIDYAHTPDALQKALTTLRSSVGNDKNIVLLFGCGGDRDKGKRKLMGKTASEFADKIIVTSDNSRSERPEDIIEEILSGVDKTKDCAVIVNRQKAIEQTIYSSTENDVILLAGKGHEEYEIENNEKRFFSERMIAEKAALWRYLNL